MASRMPIDKSTFIMLALQSRSVLHQCLNIRCLFKNVRVYVPKLGPYFYSFPDIIH